MLAFAVVANRGTEPSEMRPEKRLFAFSILYLFGLFAALVVSVVRRRGGPTALPPGLDLPAPVLGTVGLVGAAIGSGVGSEGNDLVALIRTLAGAAFLGSVTDAMLLGHWYLVQPGLGRAPLHELNRWLAEKAEEAGAYVLSETVGAKARTW